MNFTEFILGIVAITTFGSVMRSYLEYKQKTAEARIKVGGAPDASVSAEISALKRQVTELRDVTTQYDMSFDSALHRVESRLSTFEQRVRSLEQSSSATQATR